LILKDTHFLPKKPGFAGKKAAKILLLSELKVRKMKADAYSLRRLLTGRIRAALRVW
jgi:hypothetical protein